MVDLLNADWKQETSTASVRKDLSVMRLGGEVLRFLASLQRCLSSLREGFKVHF